MHVTTKWRNQGGGVIGTIATPTGRTFYIVLKYLNLKMEILIKYFKNVKNSIN